MGAAEPGKRFASSWLATGTVHFLLLWNKMGGISAKRMYNFCSHQKCHVAVYEVARIFCRKCTAWGQEQCGMGTHGNGEKKSGCCCASLHSTSMQLMH